MEKDEKLVNVGVLGCGPIAQAAHFDACTKAHNIRLYAICDVAEDLLAQMNRKWQPEKTYTDFDLMLSDPQLDAVIIATADVFHVALAKKAVAAGKHVFVEKPVGVDIGETEELSALVKKSGLVFQVGNMKRFDPGTAFAKKFIGENGGTMVSCSAWYCDSAYRYDMTDDLQPQILTSSLKKPAPGGNPKADKRKYYLMTHGVHLFDTIQFIAGTVEWMEAYLSETGGIYTWMITSGIKDSEAVIHAHLTVAVRDDWQEGFVWFGDRGSVHCKTYLPWYYKSSEVRCFSAETGQYTSVLGADAHFYKLELEAFADAVQHKKVSPVSIDEGIHDLRVLVAVSESVKQRGHRVYTEAVTGSVT